MAGRLARTLALIKSAMPFTPFHMGSGLVFKAVAGKHFSLLAFGVAQVAMDIEPLIGIVFGFEVLHGPTHTYLAAFIIGVLVSFIAPPIIRPILQRWDQELRFYRLGRFSTAFPLSRLPVAVGAFAGTFSHVALDSIMHSEMTPLAPWSNSNSLLGLVSMDSLYQLCVIVGAFGLALYDFPEILKRIIIAKARAVIILLFLSVGCWHFFSHIINSQIDKSGISDRAIHELRNRNQIPNSTPIQRCGNCSKSGFSSQDGTKTWTFTLIVKDPTET